MASVAKWLRQWIVIPPLAGSSPVVRPLELASAAQKNPPLVATFCHQTKKEKGLLGFRVVWQLLERYGININRVSRSRIVTGIGGLGVTIALTRFDALN